MFFLVLLLTLYGNLITVSIGGIITVYLPDWILCFKEPLTEIKKIKNGFYKYQVTYSYNKEKKRTEKKTVRLLGKITEAEGFILLQKTSSGVKARKCQKWISKLLAFSIFSPNSSKKSAFL